MVQGRRAGDVRDSMMVSAHGWRFSTARTRAPRFSSAGFQSLRNDGNSISPKTISTSRRECRSCSSRGGRATRFDAQGLERVCAWSATRGPPSRQGRRRRRGTRDRLGDSGLILGLGHSGHAASFSGEDLSLTTLHVRNTVIEHTLQRKTPLNGWPEERKCARSSNTNTATPTYCSGGDRSADHRGQRGAHPSPRRGVDRARAYHGGKAVRHASRIGLRAPSERYRVSTSPACDLGRTRCHALSNR